MAGPAGGCQNTSSERRERCERLGQPRPCRHPTGARGPHHRGGSTMSHQLHMVQLALESRKLSKWALDRRLGDSDLGYTCHALMCDAFGGLRLQPFAVEEKMGRVKVLGYSAV